MLKFILVLVAWFIFLKFNIKKKGGILNTSSFLLVIYLISFVFAIIHILYNGIELAYERKYWFGVVFAFFSLLVYFSPYYRFRETNVKELKLPALSILSVLSILLIIISFFSILYWLPYVGNLFLHSADLGEMRNDYVAGNLTMGAGGIVQTLAGISAHLYFLNIIVYFIFKALDVKRSQRLLLLISSVSYVVYVFSAVGRDGVVFWMFSFVACYLFFRPYLDVSTAKTYKKLIVAAASVMLIPFMMISSSRFSGGVGGSLVAYMGQSLPNFCFYFCSENPPVNYGSVFPYFCELLGLPHSSEYWAVEGTTSTSFGYFITGFYSSLGFFGFSLLEFAVVVLLLLNFKKNEVGMSFSCIILYFLFFQIFSQGVFYFRQYSAAGNILIIISFILIVAFSFVSSPLKVKQKNVQ